MGRGQGEDTASKETREELTETTDALPGVCICEHDGQDHAFGDGSGACNDCQCEKFLSPEIAEIILNEAIHKFKRRQFSSMDVARALNRIERSWPT